MFSSHPTQIITFRWSRNTLVVDDRSNKHVVDGWGSKKIYYIILYYILYTTYLCEESIHTRSTTITYLLTYIRAVSQWRRRKGGGRRLEASKNEFDQKPKSIRGHNYCRWHGNDVRRRRRPTPHVATRRRRAALASVRLFEDYRLVWCISVFPDGHPSKY